MSSCEKCWRDSRRWPGVNADLRYARLIVERRCTPEEQAGEGAELCRNCEREAVHIRTGECMACGER